MEDLENKNKVNPQDDSSLVEESQTENLSEEKKSEEISQAEENQIDEKKSQDDSSLVEESQTENLSEEKKSDEISQSEENQIGEKKSQDDSSLVEESQTENLSEEKKSEEISQSEENQIDEKKSQDDSNSIGNSQTENLSEEKKSNEISQGEENQIDEKKSQDDSSLVEESQTENLSEEKKSEEISQGEENRIDEKKSQDDSNSIGNSQTENLSEEKKSDEISQGEENQIDEKSKIDYEPDENYESIAEVIQEHEEEIGDSFVDDFIDEVPMDEELVTEELPQTESPSNSNPLLVQNEQSHSKTFDETSDGKLIINRIYDLSVKKAVKEASKVIEDKKSEKVVRDIPWEKLPKLFKKSYSEGALKRTVLKKIYIPEDRQNVANLFIPGADERKPEKLAIPRTSLFSKGEIKKYKYLAKEIKNQNKFAIKLLPLFAVILLLVGAVSWIFTNKNRFVRNFIVSTCEMIFQAKTDVGYVDVDIFDLCVTVGGLQVGNKNSVMKNLFEINRIQLDFDLVQLLKKRVVCENLEASGIAWNTNRKTSCALPNGYVTGGDAFTNAIANRINATVNGLKNDAYELFGGSTPEEIFENVKKNIHTPEMVEQTITEMNLLYERWKDKPELYKKQILEFTDSVKDLQTINLKGFDPKNPQDYARLKDAYDKITFAINQGKSLTATVQKAVEDIATDTQNVSDMAKNISDTVKGDYEYVVQRLTTITGTLANVRGLMNHALDSLICNLLGQYYPYYIQGMDILKTIQSEQKDKPKKEKKESRRLAGTDFSFTPAYPSLLVKNVKITGTGFSCFVKELTNNQNVRGVPTSGNLNLEIKGIEHKASFTFDNRRTSKAPLVAVEYGSAGYNLGLDGTSVATKKGVPSVTGKASINLKGTANFDGFTANGFVDLYPVSLTSDGFDNKLVTKYYNVGLSSIDRLNFGLGLGYNKNDGFFMNLDGNIGDQFVDALKNIVMQLGRDAKDLAFKKLEEYLNNSENKVLAWVKEFLNIEGDIDLQSMKLSDVQQILINKKNEIEVKLREKAQDIKEEVTERVNEKIDEAKNQLTEIITEKTNEIKEQVNEKINEAKDQVTEKVNEAKDQVTDRINEAKDQVTDRINEAKDQVNEKVNEAKDQVNDKINEAKDSIRDKITSSLGIKKDEKSDTDEEGEEGDGEDESESSTTKKDIFGGFLGGFGKR